MAQQPAVVIIARHGPRLDAADQSWHLSTPTPYDPPLTYGGWGQCRPLGLRIASLLDAREKAANEAASEPVYADGITAHDFARQNGEQKRKHAPSDGSPHKRRKRHRVVIHTSPFLRCVQTSVAIAAGMAQLHPTLELGSRPGTSRSRTPSSLHSASPRLRALDGLGSPNLAPISEPREDLAHAIARRVLSEHKRHRVCKLRVDAFLGEWLNPQYFEQITPPPPSAMMVATAKGELLESEPVDIFTPTISTKSSHSSLWGGASTKRADTKDSVLEEWDELEEALPGPALRRGRTSSMSSLGSNDSNSGTRSPIGRGPRVQDFASTVSKPETAVYIPPTPHYAVSGSDVIPRGYVTHARQACVDVDYAWDSSRPPQDWGDGGEYGEEWSAMHKRFRKGLNHLVAWYGQHGADDRAEDALGFDQAEHHEHHDEEEDEDLVVILVTHGAGSNALIGALTGQPVLLDVGMANLTMAVRRDDAPALSSSAPAAAIAGGHGRRASTIDSGLSSLYEMKLISSSEHLRPGADPRKASSFTQSDTRTSSGTGTPSTHRNRHGVGSHSPTGPSIESGRKLNEPIRSRSSTSTALGSMLRPSAHNVPSASTVPSLPPGPGSMARSSTSPLLVRGVPAGVGSTPPMSPGLWTPQAGRTPLLEAQQKSVEDRTTAFSSLNEVSERVRPGQDGQDMVLDSSTSPPDSRSTSSSGEPAAPAKASATDAALPTSTATPGEGSTPARQNAMSMALNGCLDGTAFSESSNQLSTREEHGSLSHDPSIASAPPQAPSRGLSQRGLWGSKPAGDNVARSFGQEPKRRWTVNKEDA